MTDLDVKKMKVELMRVTTAKAELDLRIEERLEEIQRLRDHIAIQEEKEIELKMKLEEIK